MKKEDEMENVKRIIHEAEIKRRMKS